MTSSLKLTPIESNLGALNPTLTAPPKRSLNEAAKAKGAADAPRKKARKAAIVEESEEEVVEEEEKLVVEEEEEVVEEGDDESQMESDVAVPSLNGNSVERANMIKALLATAACGVPPPIVCGEVADLYCELARLANDDASGASVARLADCLAGYLGVYKNRYAGELSADEFTRFCDAVRSCKAIAVHYHGKLLQAFADRFRVGVCLLDCTDRAVVRQVNPVGSPRIPQTVFLACNARNEYAKVIAVPVVVANECC